MTYVSCYYHAFQGAQQVGNVTHVPEPTRQYTYVPNNYNVTKLHIDTLKYEYSISRSTYLSIYIYILLQFVFWTMCKTTQTPKTKTIYQKMHPNALVAVIRVYKLFVVFVQTKFLCCSHGLFKYAHIYTYILYIRFAQTPRSHWLIHTVPPLLIRETAAMAIAELSQARSPTHVLSPKPPTLLLSLSLARLSFIAPLHPPMIRCMLHL